MQTQLPITPGMACIRAMQEQLPITPGMACIRTMQEQLPRGLDEEKNNRSLLHYYFCNKPQV